MIKKKIKSSAVLYLTESSLSLQTEKKVLLTIIFPKELVKGKGVLDKEALEAFISDKLSKKVEDLDLRALVIGKGILFQTAVLLDGEEEKEKQFYSSIPFEESDISEVRVKTSKKEYILVTSNKFYQSVINGLNGQSIVSVVPLSLFVDQVDEDELKGEDVKIILSREKLYSQANFLDSKVKESSIAEQKAGEDFSSSTPSVGKPAQLPPFMLVKKWNITALLIILGFLVISTLVFGIFLFIEQKRFSQTSHTVPVVAEEITPSPTVVVKEEVDKGSLTVSVLNGTGTPGQAAKAKTAIEDIGYNSIKTGNADSIENVKSTVSFSEKVSSKQSDEVVEALKEIFSNVTVAKDDSLSDDIVIVTGEEK